MKSEDILFKLITIEILSGAGRFNKIVTINAKRSIVKVNNYDIMCLARSIIVGMAVNNNKKLEAILKHKLESNESN